MDLKFEVVVIPVSDVDRRKRSTVDVDHSAAVYEEALSTEWWMARTWRVRTRIS